MATPTRTSTVTTNPTNSTSHSFNLPTTAAGDLLFAWIVASESTLTPTGDLADSGEWTQLFKRTVIAFHTWGLWFRRCDGSESGGTITATVGSAVQAGAVVDRFRGAWGAGGEGDAFALSTVTSTGGGTGPNPNPVTAPWGSADNLAVAAATSGGTGANYTAPSGFSALAQVNAATNGHCVGTAELASSSATVDPGAFTLDDSENHQAVTLIIRPQNVSADLTISAEVSAAGLSSLTEGADLTAAMSVTASGRAGAIASVDPIQISMAAAASGTLTAGADMALALAVAGGQGFARDRGVIVPTQGQEMILRGEWSTASASTVHLIVDDPTASLDDAGRNALTETDFTEPTFTGYAAQAATGWTITPGGPTVAEADPLTFTTSGAPASPVEIDGHYVTDDATGRLVFWEIYVDGPITLADDGDETTAVPVLTLE